MINEKELFKCIRKLAKGNYWQIIYSQSKEMNSFQLFDNKKDLSFLQLLFLNKLIFYNYIYTDIALGEVEDIVLKYSIYEEAYMYYRNKSRGLESKNMNKMRRPIRQDNNQYNKSTWVFKKPKRV